MIQAFVRTFQDPISQMSAHEREKDKVFLLRGMQHRPAENLWKYTKLTFLKYTWKMGTLIEKDLADFLYV